MFKVVLLDPEIPGNTGNIGRLTLAAGASLHLVGKVGFKMDDATLRRAGVDHWRDVEVFRHATLAEFERSHVPGRIFCFSVRATVDYTAVRYVPGDALLFGCESSGLPAEVLERYGERALRIPMPGARARSLNLSNAVAVVVYEGLRQLSSG
jgi:tRNA (cytidine/uridine-2'-O-)-methyltransferase